MSSVVRQKTAGEDEWFHVSPRGEGRLRLLTDVGLVNVSADFIPSESFAEILTERQIEDLIGSNFPSIASAEKWAEIFFSLRAGNHHQSVRTAFNQIIVPVTRLREFRRSFSTWTTELKRGQAYLFAERPELLRELWQSAVLTLREYYFIQPFFPEGQRNDLPNAPTAAAQILRTPDAAAYFSQRLNGNSEIGGLTITYLDREIAPLRTPGGQFSNGVPATSTGRGGMDLLLIQRGRICAGEVKIRNDSELFDALLQSLWYASELATENQIHRIETVYREKLSDIELDKTGIDVVIFSIEQNSNTGDSTRESTIKLVNWINQKGKFDRLGTIYMLENDGDNWKRIG